MTKIFYIDNKIFHLIIDIVMGGHDGEHPFNCPERRTFKAEMGV